MTAHRCLFSDGTIRGQAVLVTGGANSVGRCAVQLAKWGGATVIAIVSRQEQADIARDAGADHVINCRNKDVVGRAKELTGGDGVDRVVEVSFSRKKPILPNRIAPGIAARIVEFSLDESAFGQIRVVNEMRKLGHSISPPEPVEGRGARRLAAP